VSVAATVPAVHIPPRQLPLEDMRLDRADARLSRGTRVLDLHEPTFLGRVAERANQLLLGRPGASPGLGEVELSERLLELPADALEWRMRFGGDHRPDELEREPDCPCLEWREPRRAGVCISEQLFLDMHVPVLERGVHRVTAASEVDEVEELEMVVELV